jgi:hypothetical protein
MYTYKYKLIIVTYDDTKIQNEILKYDQCNLPFDEYLFKVIRTLINKKNKKNKSEWICFIIFVTNLLVLSQFISFLIFF